MNPIHTFNELTAQLERLRRINLLVDQLDALGIELAIDEPSADEAELERLRLDAYVAMVHEHNARNSAASTALGATPEQQPKQKA
jgi:hypothetical protein